MLPIEQDLRDVVRFDPKDANALSLYLDTEPSRGAGQNLKAQMEDALREMQTVLGADGAQSDDIAEAASLALQGIAALRPIPRAVAAFVSPESGFLRVVPLPEPTGRSAYWGHRLHVRPLLAALDEHERTVVALVDQQHARVFRVFMGQIEEVATLEHRDSGHVQAGRAQRKSGGSRGVLASMAYGERNLQRRHEWHVRMHLERTVEAMRPNGDRLLLGGSHETMHELLRLLPKRIRDRAVLIDGLDLHAPVTTVLERVLDTQRVAEREAESEMLRELKEIDPSRSAFGAAAVAEVVADGRVHTLLYAAATEMLGAECGECGWLMPGRREASCPRCGAAMVEVLEFVERLVSRTLQSGGRIEEVRGPGQATLFKTEGLAALLRYGTPQEALSEEGKNVGGRSTPPRTERLAASSGPTP